MKKIILLLVTVILVITGCNSKNELPKEYLGKYIQDGIDTEGVAILSKKGNKYYIEMESTNYYLNTKYDATKKEHVVISKKALSKDNLVFEGKIKKIEYEEYGDIRFTTKSKDIYYILFEDIKTSGSYGNELKYSPKIRIIGDRQLEKPKDYVINDYQNSFSYQKEPISMLSIGGIEFKKTRQQKN